MWPDVWSGDLQAWKGVWSHMTLNVLTETRCHQVAQNSEFLFLSRCIVVNSFKVKQVYSHINCILNYFPPIMKRYGKIYSTKLTAA